MVCIICAILIFIFEAVYLSIARKCGALIGMGDPTVDPRGAVRSAGIVFIFAAWLAEILAPQPAWLFLLGATTLAITGYIDDLKPLHYSPRFCIQVVAVALLLWGLNLLAWPWLLIAAAILGGVGVVNAFNFMDGINGMTAIYTIAVVVPLLWLNHSIDFMGSHLLLFTLFAALSFGFFNFRRISLCFAGDCGSTVVGFIVLYATARLIYATGQWYWLGIMAVYGADTALTLTYRIFTHQKFLEGHRQHIFQKLVDRCGYGHLKVASSYALVQLTYTAALIWLPVNRYATFAIGIGLLIAAYLISFRFVSRESHKLNNPNQN